MINSVALLEIRSKRRLSQEALGKAIGQNGRYISDLETGRRCGINTRTLIKLADVLGCSTDTLLGRTRKVYA